ncbi:MAG: Eco57I restriction-modification methylase domain-containing protein, partial [Candidatus Hodarchaeota archaeon]
MQSTKSLGAIYTPNSVALSMCKSVLVDYICGEIDCFYKSYNDLIKEEKEQQQRSIIQNLRQIRVLDPACGDGHFLLAMLLILEEIYLKFKKKTPSLVPYSESEIREHIILNNLFGVDVFPEAVKACKAKLSRMMGEKKESRELILSHFHIDLHIRTGNSVLGLYARGKPKLTDFFEKLASSLIEKRNNLVNAYEKATGDLKNVKRRELLSKTKKWSLTFTEGLLSKEGLEIIGSKYTAEQFNEKFKPFHWIMEFSQIFGTLKRGFDVIIGNPPYVKADSQDEGFQEYRKITGKLFGTFEEKWDLYIAFLELGLRLLKPRGVLSFIISDSFSTAKYASKMRRLLLSKKVLSVSFFPGIKIFQDVGIQNIIITVRNEEGNEKHQTKR